MKLSDFTFEYIHDDKDNVVKDAKGDPEIWEGGSKNDKRGKGRYGGKLYQVKVHQQEPIWNNVSKAISQAEAEMRNLPKDDDDYDKKVESIKSKIESLKRAKPRKDREDAVADDYVAIKKNLIKELQGLKNPYIVAPADFWKEEVSFKGNKECAIEATPWFENVAVWFEPTKPIVFNRDLDKKQQYAIIASLAERVAELHAGGIIHGDLKIGNTLITKSGSDFKAVLIDFDGAIVLKDLKSDKFKFGAWRHVVVGTYFAPESLQLLRYVGDEDNEDFSDFDLDSIGTASDIFGLGVTIHEYLFGNKILPMRSKDGDLIDNTDYDKNLIDGGRFDFDESYDDFLYGMFNWMLAAKAEDRPTAAKVKEAFLTENAGLIPDKFVRNPLWEEHRAEYEAVPVDGKSIMRAKNGMYVIKTPVSRTGGQTIDDLYKEGLVKRKDGLTPPPPGGDSDVDKVWESDGAGKLPLCAERAKKDGTYKLYAGGAVKMVSYAQLVEMGVICSDAELSLPWPMDKGLRFIDNGSKKITRDMRKNKGPGYYKIGGTGGESCDAERLIARTLASRGVNFSLHNNDAELYQPNPEALPANTDKVIRRTQNHLYRIIYTDGTYVELMIADMLAKGYVKKK